MSEYKSEIDKMKWSYSRLTTYEQCGYEFYLSYIANDEENYPYEGNYYSDVGTYVHEILAKIFNGKLNPEDAAKYFEENFDKNVFYKTKESTMKHTYEACRRYFRFEDFLWLNDYEILGVEKPVEFDVGGYTFVGYIDLLLRDKRDNKIVLVDNKSSAYPFKRNGTLKTSALHSFEKYKKQMYLYSHAVFLEYGEYPKTIMWNHFKDDGRLAEIQFSKQDYDRAIQWAIDTIHKIEKEENFSEHMEYFYCTNLCKFSNCCEYLNVDRRR